MAKCLVVCLHGFLGRGIDWKPLTEKLREENKDLDLEFWCPDMLSPESVLNPKYDFRSWVTKFMGELKQFSYDKCLLLSYSMGGRLALHALIANEKEFSGAVFLSTNPALPSEEQLEKRKLSDEEWSKKFVTNKWPELISQWNQLPVFAQEDTHPDRNEANYSRRYLGLALQNWSITRHQVSLDDLQKIACPNLWVAGELDHKFVAIMKYMEQKAPNSTYYVLPGKAHRLGFDAHPNLVARIIEFIHEHLGK